MCNHADAGDRLPATPAGHLSDIGVYKRSEARIEKILDAALAIFGERGYQHARLSEIVARAGGSMTTIYRAFGDKQGLARAIIERNLHDMNERIDALQLSGLPPEQALPQAACLIADFLSTTESVVVCRIVIGEGQSFPELRDWYFQNAIKPAQDRLRSYFAEEAAAGRLQFPSPARAAIQFRMMLFGDWALRVSSGYMRQVDSQTLCSFAQEAARTFLLGALPR